MRDWPRSFWRPILLKPASTLASTWPSAAQEELTGQEPTQTTTNPAATPTARGWLSASSWKLQDTSSASVVEWPSSRTNRASTSLPDIQHTCSGTCKHCGLSPPLCHTNFNKECKGAPVKPSAGLRIYFSITPPTSTPPEIGEVRKMTPPGDSGATQMSAPCSEELEVDYF